LKSYLDLGPNRPLWASVADALFALKTPLSEGKVDPKVRLNIFLQSWKSRATEKSGICPDLLQLLTTARKYGVRPEGIAFSKDIVQQRPIWYHSDADPKIRRHAHGRTAVCLRDKHGVRTVGDAEKWAIRLTDSSHRVDPSCECPSCMQVEEDVGCLHPHDCCEKAKQLLQFLPPKWNPTTAPNEETRVPGDSNDSEWIVFQRGLVTSGPLADIFRIFTSGRTVGGLPTLSPPTNSDRELCINNGDDDAQAGAGVFCEADHPLNRSIKVPAAFVQSNQSAEMLALKEA
ncbi:hypothetical protein FPV67DRAFT_1373029, partial [Lyophyllum atratum]